jgi:hypothetical protein
MHPWSSVLETCSSIRRSTAPCRSREGIHHNLLMGLQNVNANHMTGEVSIVCGRILPLIRIDAIVEHEFDIITYPFGSYLIQLRHSVFSQFFPLWRCLENRRRVSRHRNSHRSFHRSRQQRGQILSFLSRYAPRAFTRKARGATDRISSEEPARARRRYHPDRSQPSCRLSRQCR